MSQPPRDIAPDQFIVFFQTNERIPAREAARFITELDRIARLRWHLGPDGVFELLEAQTGTLWVRFAAIVGALGGAAGIGSFVLDLTERLQKADNKLAECTAKIVIDHGIRSVTMITCDGSSEILREMMPAVSRIENQRSATTGRALEPEVTEKLAASDESDAGQMDDGWGGAWGQDWGGTDRKQIRRVEETAGQYIQRLKDEAHSPLEIARHDAPMPEVVRHPEVLEGYAINKGGWSLVELDGTASEMLPITGGLDLFPSDWMEARVSGHLLTIAGRNVALQAIHVTGVDKSPRSPE